MATPHSIEDEAVATEAVDMATLLSENASLRDRLLRALAEAENTRRQADRRAEDTRKFAIAEFARELLIVVDNLQRVIEASKSGAAHENSALVQGAESTLRLFIQTLERFGVNRIEALGQKFDPTLHEAVMQVDDPSHAPGIVIRVVEEGYTINERLLRPARVIVAKKHADHADATADSDAPASEVGQ